jgi:NitT/TauT family transport system substrate-binding protein
VVQPDIGSAADLKGRTVASPQLGGTQDVALRYWLKQQGLSAPVTGTGDVTVAPQENSQTLDLFKQGKIAGAWVPEPWASRLVTEGGGKVLVDEKDLWPSGQFVTTPHRIGRFLPRSTRAREEADPGRGRHPRRDHKGPARRRRRPTGPSRRSPEAAQGRRSTGLLTILRSPRPGRVDAAGGGGHGVEVGTTKADLSGIYDLTLLNEVLEARGGDCCVGVGLGKE